MTNTIKAFRLWRIMPTGDVIHAGDIAAKTTPSGGLILGMRRLT